jgi:hypothetical protein
MEAKHNFRTCEGLEEVVEIIPDGVTMLTS